jgi:hypothetical protein
MDDRVDAVDNSEYDLDAGVRIIGRLSSAHAAKVDRSRESNSAECVSERGFCKLIAAEFL